LPITRGTANGIYKADFNISNLWCADKTESGSYLIFTPLSYNNTISPGGTVTFGFNGTGTPVSGFYYKIE
jgi:cellulase/cellobiase CelA1